MRLSPVLVLLVLAGCPRETPDTDTDVPVANFGPELSHTPATSATQGVEIPVEITATDDQGVDQVKVLYRTQGQAAWDTLFLDKSGDVWTGTIPAEGVEAPAVEYYVRAQDASDLHAVSYLPTGGDRAPFAVPVDVIGRALPFTEDFEAATNLYSLGWDEVAEGFPGYIWSLSTSRKNSGAQSAEHKRGIADIDPLEDWLVSPPLDFSTLEQIELSWYEYGDYAELGTHSLWISSTSWDPSQGGFELVAELPAAPEDSWGQSAIYDLSAWAGNDAVWLAWYYEGEFTDSWYIDDVVVKELGPELTANELTWSPDPVRPGETTTLSVDVENLTAIASGDITVTWIVDAGSATVGSPTSEGAIDGLGTATWSTTLTVDPSYPDNAWLPVTIEATDGVETWTWSERIVVGLPSTAIVEVDAAESGLVTLTLGVGDPDAPDLTVPVAAKVVDALPNAFEVDLTDYWQWLPPAAGDLRWWLQVDTDVKGEVTDFTIEWDGASYSSDDIGEWTAEQTSYFYLPRPPEPVIFASSTSPTQVAPGDVVDWTVWLENAGADTVGRTTVSLGSSDPDVTVLSTSPVLLDPTAWSGTSDVELQFQVSESHVDSSPVELELVVTDEVESFAVSGMVDVPWPVLQVTAVRVDDWADGDNDGLLDPDETANLEIDLTNIGDLSAFGAVSCTLSSTGGTASATMLTSKGSFGLLSAGASKTEDDFEVQVTSGAVGDTLDMALVCTDGTESYTTGFELVLGEPPWLSLTTSPDPTGDVVGGYDFDHTTAQYRSDGTTLEIRFDSAKPYDASTLFLESWMTSSGGAYTYYQLVLQSGKATMRGYKSGSWKTLSSPAITYVDTDTVEIAIDIPSLGLALERLSAGFAAGFCGGDDYYCDQYPDGWGNPYQTGFYDSLFAQMSW